MFKKQKILIIAAIIIMFTGSATVCNASTVNNNPKFYIQQANQFLNNGNLSQAEELAKKVIKISYNSPDAFIVLGNVYFEKAISLENTQENMDFKKSYLTKSFDNFYTAYKYNPASPFAHIGIAKNYYLNGQTSLAEDEILKAKELSIDNPEAIYSIGEYYYKSKNYTKARTYLEKSLNAGLTSKYKTFYMLGTIYEQEGKTENAQKSYVQALKIKPEDIASQQNLDRLIKTTYKEVETSVKTNKPTADLFNNLNDELNTVMQADNYLVIDEFSKARELYLKVLSNNPENVNAITGLAELYYAKWVEGFQNSSDFINDSKYIFKAKETPRIAIPLTKFKLINEEIMPEKIRQKLINLSVSETFDFYDTLNEVRAEFLLGNFEQSHEKLQKLLTFNLSNFEKFKALKSLCYDHNYDEALILIRDLKKTSYRTEELTPIVNRINTKFKVADEKLNQAISLYTNKNDKQNDFSQSEEIIKQAIRYFPTYRKGYIHYAYLLEKQKKYKEALEKVNIYYGLYKLYPDKNTEISEADVNKLIQRLNQKSAEVQAKN